MQEKNTKYLPESKEYFSKNASSWFVRSSNIGSISYCSMTFVDYIQKVHINESTKQMGSDTDLIAEAVCNITLTAESAIQLATTILSQFGIQYPAHPLATNVNDEESDINKSSCDE